jgi:hypothetical protein
MDHSGDLVAVLAPTIPQPAEAANAMFWAQLSGCGVNPGDDRVAPFDMEAAPMGLGMDVGQAQTLNSLVHNDSFAPTQAALQPELADLGIGSGTIIDYLDLLIGTAAYTGTAQEPDEVQHPGYGPLSPAPPGRSSPVSDSDWERIIISRLSSPSLPYLSTRYGELTSEHGDEGIAPAFFDN